MGTAPAAGKTFLRLFWKNDSVSTVDQRVCRLFPVFLQSVCSILRSCENMRREKLSDNKIQLTTFLTFPRLLPTGPLDMASERSSREMKFFSACRSICGISASRHQRLRRFTCRFFLAKNRSKREERRYVAHKKRSFCPSSRDAKFYSLKLVIRSRFSRRNLQTLNDGQD